jgi:hypothetical protein
LNNENEIDWLKKEFILTFKTSDYDHEIEINPIKKQTTKNKQTKLARKISLKGGSGKSLKLTIREIWDLDSIKKLDFLQI